MGRLRDQVKIQWHRLELKQVDFAQGMQQAEYVLVIRFCSQCISFARANSLFARVTGDGQKESANRSLAGIGPSYRQGDFGKTAF